VGAVLLFVAAFQDGGFDFLMFFKGRGGAACKRCPAIATVSYDLSAQAQEVSGLPVIEEPATPP